MQTETYPTKMSMNWFDILRLAFLHPTLETFSDISSDPKAGIQWGLTWAALASLVAWIVGPQRDLLGGWVRTMFGLRSLFSFYLIGAFVAPVFGILALLISAALAHGFARLFEGAGTFRQLFYCWAVMPLPFILLAGLVLRFPSMFSPSREFIFSKTGLIIQYAVMLAALCVYLYLFYARVVAFSAVENFGIGKGLGVLILLAVAVGIAAGCLSFGFQAVSMNLFRY